MHITPGAGVRAPRQELIIPPNIAFGFHSYSAALIKRNECAGFLKRLRIFLLLVAVPNPSTVPESKLSSLRASERAGGARHSLRYEYAAF